MYRINKIINITAFAIIQMLFVLTLTVIRSNNINIYADNALYTNSDVLTLMQLLIGTFALQVIAILIINGINKVTDILDKRSTPLAEDISEQITNLEKESGIITISPCRFKAAFQVKGMQNNNYYYAVQNYPKYKKKDLYVISNWNIRVKPINHYVTKISVNLLDNGRVIAIDDDKKQTELDLANQSTGTFEKKILYQILDNLRKRNFDEYDWRYYEGENH